MGILAARTSIQEGVGLKPADQSQQNCDSAVVMSSTIPRTNSWCLRSSPIGSNEANILRKYQADALPSQHKSGFLKQNKRVFSRRQDGIHQCGGRSCSSHWCSARLWLLRHL